MNIIVVDDELDALECMELAVRTATPKAKVSCFQWPQEALDHAAENRIDVAFLDIEMGSCNGLTVAKKLKEINANANIVFVTAHTEYMGHAFSMHASGYVMKPATPERVAAEMEHLRHPVDRSDKGIRVQTFGSFELFVDGKPVFFSRSKSKEILAFLVDRKGAGVTRKELAAVLWEDGEYNRATQEYIKKVLTDMMKSLRAVEAEHIIIKRYNYYAVDPAAFECDYYSYNNWDMAAINRFAGEYMANYSWAEFTTGWIGAAKSDE